MIEFTIADAWAVILSVCGGIITISAVVSLAIKIAQHFRKPNLEQNEEIAKLWKEVNAMKEEHGRVKDEFISYFANDKERLDAIDRGNKVMLQAMLALLSHGIDGNDIASMKTAKKDLEDYLIAK